MTAVVRTVMSHLPFAAVEIFALAVLAAVKLAVLSVYAGIDLVMGSAFAPHAVAHSVHTVLEFASVMALSSFEVFSSVVMIGRYSQPIRSTDL